MHNSQEPTHMDSQHVRWKYCKLNLRTYTIGWLDRLSTTIRALDVEIPEFSTHCHQSSLKLLSQAFYSCPNGRNCRSRKFSTTCKGRRWRNGGILGKEGKREREEGLLKKRESKRKKGVWGFLSKWSWVQLVSVRTASVDLHCSSIDWANSKNWVKGYNQVCFGSKMPLIGSRKWVIGHNHIYGPT